jgi:hypothetical protein
MSELAQVLPTADEFGGAIRDALASGELAPVETPLQHYHTPELYGRRIVVPAVSVFTTKVHKTDHISIALRGYITIIDTTDGSQKEVRAPDVFVTPAGTQRIVYVHEEVEFMTVHPCKEQDIEAIEKALTCDTMAEYNTLQIEAQQCLS